MEHKEYKRFFDFEESYWWFRGLRAILLNTLKELGLGNSDRILDAGCGTGKNMQAILERITPHSFGFDLSPHASPFWPLYGLQHVCLASVNEIPFRDASFDAVLCSGVLECEEVLVKRAYRELWRVVKPEGYIVLVVPAHPWLFSEEHHKTAHTCKRYTKRELLSLLGNAPVQIIRVTHLFPCLFPLIASYRIFRRFFTRSSDERPRSDLRPLPRLLNEIFFRIVDAERSLLSKIDFPFGSSMFAIVQKD